MKDQKRFAALALSAVMVFSMAGSVSAAQKVESKDDLAGATIGVQLGTTGDLDASDYEKDGSTVERYSKGSEAVQALKAGQIDCVIIDSQPAQKFAENNDDLKILDEPFEEEEYAICLKKGNDELLDKINGALKELKEDGTIDSIMDNYIGEDAGKTPYESPEDVDRSNGTLVMATNAEFEPYEYHEGDDIVGIDADIAQAICDKLGYELKIEDMEFDSILPAVQSGKADFGAAGMTVTEDRATQVDFSDSYYTGVQVIIVTDDSDITEPDDLKGKKIAVQATTKAEDLFLHKIASDLPQMGQVNCFSTTNELYAALRKNYVDAIAGHEAMLGSLVRDGEDAYRMLDESIYTSELGIAFKKGTHEEVAQELTETLEEMRNEGITEEIVTKYGLDADEILPEGESK